MNESRFALFMKVNSPKGKHPMASVKGIDGSLLPPCRSVLIEKIKRSIAICSIWNSAIVLKPTIFPSRKKKDESMKVIGIKLIGSKVMLHQLTLIRLLLKLKKIPR